MKKRSLKYLFSIISLVSLGTFLTMFSNATLSWFMTKDQVSFNDEAFGKGLANYFESGDGSEESPYVISNSTHFYNFAWLQYLGQFNKDEDGDGNIDQKYFKLKNDINMKGFILPPVGTEENPFVGNFNGQNYIINNLTVSNSYDDLKTSRHPSTVNASNYVQMNIVGTFGIIGQYNTTLSYTSSINSVSNFYLENVSILTDSTNLLVGIFAGYANGVISNCGVHSSNVKVKSGTSYITESTLSKYNDSKVSKYTLLGAYNSTDYKWEDQEGGDTGYGTSTDIKALHLSLIENGLNDGDTGKISSKYVLPFKYESDTLVQGTGSQITVTTSGSRTQNINPTNYYTYKASTKGNNLGYYVGEVKTYEMSLDYNVSDFGVQTQSGLIVTNRNLKTPPDDVLSYLKEKGTHLIRLNNGYSSDNLTTSTFSYVENGQVGDWTGNLLLPSNGIWVAPKENGTFKFAFYNASYSKNGSVGILFTELKRVTPGDYSSAFVANTLICSGLEYSCKYGYFEKTAYAGYEYYIAFYNTSSYDAPYIAYMDIGTNGGTDEDTRTVLTNIDYVTTDSSNSIIKMDDSSYTKSNVSFTISPGLDDTYTYYFKRNSDGVYYYVIDNGYNYITSNGTGTSVKSKDENCDEQA